MKCDFNCKESFVCKFCQETINYKIKLGVDHKLCRLDKCCVSNESFKLSSNTIHDS